ncbi:MAG TPA: DUF350 domain-containing protein [Burkholderiaceae bacterium]|nr:DUF350 domain-containing protein [Burkholderiaceae bacterium]
MIAMEDLSLSSAIVESMADLPYAVAHYGTGLIVYALAVAAYVASAPVPEFRLLRQGNRAAALSLAGAMLGLALPLASTILMSGSLLDVLVWSTAASVLQLSTVGIVRRVIPDLSAQIVGGDWAGGAFVGMLAVVVGLLNAAAMAV